MRGWGGGVRRCGREGDACSLIYLEIVPPDL